MTKTLLVTGASGFLGWNLCQLAAHRWQVYGTYQSRSPAIPQTTLLPVNLTDRAALTELFQQVQPDAVVHLAAQANANRCETDPDTAYQINVLTAWAIADLCADRAIPLAFTSTDLVFDGKNAPYTERDPVSPLSRYGEQKVLAETGILDRYPKAAICRMPLLFGAAHPTASSFLQGFAHSLRTGQDLRLFTDEFRTPASGTTAAKGLLLALETVEGLIHLGGAERVSRYEFGQLMVETLDLPGATLSACQQSDVPMAAARPADVSLDSTKAFALGYAPRSLRAELQALRGLV